MSFLFSTGALSPLARAVSAEIRSEMAVQRVTGRALAGAAEYASHNYVAERLRDEKPFTLDDVDRLCRALDVDSAELIQRAWQNHGPRLQREAEDDVQRHSYALETEDGEVAYVGQATNVKRRLDQHRRGASEPSEEDDARRAAEHLDDHLRNRSPRGAEEMQQMQDQAARDEDRKA